MSVLPKAMLMLSHALQSVDQPRTRLVFFSSLLKGHSQWDPPRLHPHAHCGMPPHNAPSQLTWPCLYTYAPAADDVAAAVATIQQRLPCASKYASHLCSNGVKEAAVVVHPHYVATYRHAEHSQWSHGQVVQVCVCVCLYASCVVHDPSARGGWRQAPHTPSTPPWGDPSECSAACRQLSCFQGLKGLCCLRCTQTV